DTRKGYPYINTQTIPICRGTPEQEAGGIEVHCHFRYHKSYALVGSNWTSKGNTLFRIIHCILECSPSHTTGNACTQDVVQRCGTDHAFIPWLAQHTSLRNCRIGEAI